MKVFDGCLVSEMSAVSGHMRLRGRRPPDGDGQLQEGQRLRGQGLPVSCCCPGSMARGHLIMQEVVTPGSFSWAQVKS